MQWYFPNIVYGSSGCKSVFCLTTWFHEHHCAGGSLLSTNACNAAAHAVDDLSTGSLTMSKYRSSRLRRAWRKSIWFLGLRWRCRLFDDFGCKASSSCRPSSSRCHTRSRCPLAHSSTDMSRFKYSACCLVGPSICTDFPWRALIWRRR